MKKKYFIYSVILLFFACNSHKETSTETEEILSTSIVELNENQVKNANISIVTPQKRELNAMLIANGFTDVPPQNLVNISAIMGGYLKYTHLIPGMHVKKGEKIATLEDLKYITLQENYLTTKVKFSQLEKELSRQTELNQSKATSDKALEQIKSEYLTQKIILQSLRQQLSMININPDQLNEQNIQRQIDIFSPIDGYVTKVHVNIGKYVQPSETLFELVDPSDVHIKLSIFEKDIHKIYVGQSLKAYTNKDNKEYACNIVFIGKELAKDRSIEVHCHCEGLDKNVVIGEYVMAEIPLKTENMNWVVPEEAVLRFEGKEYVFVEIGRQKYDMVHLETGLRQNGYVAIKFNEKITENSRIVVKGAYNLLMKLKNTEED